MDDRLRFLAIMGGAIRPGDHLTVRWALSFRRRVGHVGEVMGCFPDSHNGQWVYELRFKDGEALYFPADRFAFDRPPAASRRDGANDEGEAEEEDDLPF